MRMDAPHREAISFDLVVPGDPKSKARPRIYKGHGVTPVATRIAEERLRGFLRGTIQGLPDGRRAYGTRIEFHTEGWQRRDLDNMVKLVWDACTGIVWDDDSQVVELTSRLRRNDPPARTRIVVYPLDDPLFETRCCEICGSQFRVYRSQPNRFCSIAHRQGMPHPAPVRPLRQGDPSADVPRGEAPLLLGRLP
jgi:hypothetical protein